MIRRAVSMATSVWERKKHCFFFFFSFGGGLAGYQYLYNITHCITGNTRLNRGIEPLLQMFDRISSTSNSEMMTSFNMRKVHSKDIFELFSRGWVSTYLMGWEREREIRSNTGHVLGMATYVLERERSNRMLCMMTGACNDRCMWWQVHVMTGACVFVCVGTRNEKQKREWKRADYFKAPSVVVCQQQTQDQNSPIPHCQDHKTVNNRNW